MQVLTESSHPLLGVTELWHAPRRQLRGPRLRLPGFVYIRE